MYYQFSTHPQYVFIPFWSDETEEHFRQEMPNPEAYIFAYRGGLGLVYRSVDGTPVTRGEYGKVLDRQDLIKPPPPPPPKRTPVAPQSMYAQVLIKIPCDDFVSATHLTTLLRMILFGEVPLSGSLDHNSVTFEDLRVVGHFTLIPEPEEVSTTPPIVINTAVQ